MRAAGVLALALAASACDQPVPPPVFLREASLDVEDIAVLRALFDDFRHRRREAIVRPEVPSPRFLVVDTTMAMCRRDPSVFGPQPGRCLNPAPASVMSEVVPASVFPTVRLRFQTWNATPRSISGGLGDDVTYVSATLLDMMAPGELLRRYPPGSAIVTLSAPGYPAPRMAVIAFGSWWAPSSGAARLERQPDGHWRVVASASRPQD